MKISNVIAILTQYWVLYGELDVGLFWESHQGGDVRDIFLTPERGTYGPPYRLLLSEEEGGSTDIETPEVYDERMERWKREDAERKIAEREWRDKAREQDAYFPFAIDEEPG